MSMAKRDTSIGRWEHPAICKSQSAPHRACNSQLCYEKSVVIPSEGNPPHVVIRVLV